MNSWQPAELEGMHDIYDGAVLPPDRRPLQILRPSDRIGVPYLRCPFEKVSAVVLTNDPDYATPLKPADSDSQLIAGHLLDFLTHECRRGRLPATLLPLQSGVGNVTNAALARLDSGPFRPLTAYTEVVQDGMLQMLRSGTMTMASATGFSLSEEGIAELHADVAAYRDKIIRRLQEISNHPEVVPADKAGQLGREAMHATGGGFRRGYPHARTITAGRMCRTGAAATPRRHVAQTTFRQSAARCAPRAAAAPDLICLHAPNRHDESGSSVGRP